MILERGAATLALNDRATGAGWQCLQHHEKTFQTGFIIGGETQMEGGVNDITLCFWAATV